MGDHPGVCVMIFYQVQYTGAATSCVGFRGRHLVLGVVIARARCTWWDVVAAAASSVWCAVGCFDVAALTSWPLVMPRHPDPQGCSVLWHPTTSVAIEGPLPLKDMKLLQSATVVLIIGWMETNIFVDYKFYCPKFLLTISGSWATHVDPGRDTSVQITQVSWSYIGYLGDLHRMLLNMEYIDGYVLC